jgi:hypothetical protein
MTRWWRQSAASGPSGPPWRPSWRPGQDARADAIEAIAPSEWSSPKHWASSTLPSTTRGRHGGGPGGRTTAPATWLTCWASCRLIRRGGRCGAAWPTGWSRTGTANPTPRLRGWRGGRHRAWSRRSLGSSAHLAHGPARVQSVVAVTAGVPECARRVHHLRRRIADLDAPTRIVRSGWWRTVTGRFWSERELNPTASTCMTATTGENCAVGSRKQAILAHVPPGYA